MPPAADAPPSSPRPIYLTFHQLLAGFYPGLTVISPRRCEELLTSLGILQAESADAGVPAFSFDLRLSFDDGYAELAELLPRWLPRLKSPPVVFIPTALIGREGSWDYLYRWTGSRHLSAQQIRQLASLGVEFGSHGHTHRALTRCNPKELREELLHSQAILTAITQRAVTAIAYPFGQSNTRVREIAVEAGYSNGFTMNLPDFHDTPLGQGRVPAYAIDTPRTLRAKLPGNPVQPIMNGLNRIIRAGGALSAVVSGRSKNCRLSQT